MPGSEGAPGAGGTGVVIDGAVVAVEVDCPDGFVGRISRNCTEDGWSPSSGHCTRLGCDALTVLLPGHEESQPRAQYDARQFARDQTEFDEAMARCYSEGRDVNHGGKPTSACVDMRAHALTFDETPAGGAIAKHDDDHDSRDSGNGPQHRAIPSAPPRGLCVSYHASHDRQHANRPILPVTLHAWPARGSVPSTSSLVSLREARPCLARQAWSLLVLDGPAQRNSR